MGLALDAHVPELGRTLADAMLEPTRIYTRALLALHRAELLRGAAHITGGGLVENPPRVVGDDLAFRFRRASIPVPPIFTLIARGGDVDDLEMLRTFNMGVGMIVVVPAAEAARARGVLADAGETVFEIGEIVRRAPGAEPVEFAP
jgi:phosphoribosylformylglycinamidine cyclo-ligase